MSGGQINNVVRSVLPPGVGLPAPNLVSEVPNEPINNNDANVAYHSPDMQQILQPERHIQELNPPEQQPSAEEKSQTTTDYVLYDSDQQKIWGCNLFTIMFNCVMLGLGIGLIACSIEGYNNDEINKSGMVIMACIGSSIVLSYVLTICVYFCSLLEKDAKFERIFCCKKGILSERAAQEIDNYIDNPNQNKEKIKKHFNKIKNYFGIHEFHRDE